ncbi:MAG: T9SS type A sorting domain-containing protein [Bacteroidota bacterium]|nr:T9SS type A sorting domain-containing protein [Bacteroidota bacterium]
MLRFDSFMKSVVLVFILCSNYGYGDNTPPLQRALAFLAFDFTVKVDQKEVSLVGHKFTLGMLLSEKALWVRVFRNNIIDSSDDIAHYYPPHEVKIVNANFKSNDQTKIIVLLSNNTTGILDITQALNSRENGESLNLTLVKLAPGINISYPKKIVGDALYIYGDNKVSVSRDTGKTWEPDSVNISKTYVTDISIDTNFYAWISTYDGVYYQHPDSSIWHKAALLPSASQGSYSIFADRKGRIFVGMGGDIAVSTDRGLSWQKISGTVSGTVDKFGDDALGNVYAINSYGAYRLSNLTLPWIRISDSLNTFNYTSSSSISINSISGDSVIYAATNYGIFESADHGMNWKYTSDNVQAYAYNFHSLVKSGNYFLVSTNSGIFRVISGDTTWEKIFPQKGFQSNLSMTTDSVGNIYSVLPKQVDKFTTTYKNYKSTDHGTTWLPDTLGLSKYVSNINSFIYNVDQQGVQYLTGTYIMYSKKPGSSWKLDTLGLNLQNVAKISSISNNNKKGVIYATKYVFSNSTYSIYGRAYNDSLWSKVNADTLGKLSGGIVSDAQGNILVQTSTGQLFRYNGSSWAQIPLPSGLGRLGAFSVDRNGVLWTEFFDLFGQILHGVYFSSDNGITWKYVGLNGVGVSSLVSMDDTTYAITFIDGIYGFTTASKPTSVWNNESQIASSYELFQNYPNPFNPTTTINYQLPKSGIVTLKIFDILGQEVATLVNEKKEAGKYQVQFDASRFASGVYLYQLDAGNYSSVKKMILMK